MMALVGGVHLKRGKDLKLVKSYYHRSGYVSEHRNPVPQRYRSEHSVPQLLLIRCYFRSNVAVEHVVVIFGLKVWKAVIFFRMVIELLVAHWIGPIIGLVITKKKIYSLMGLSFIIIE